jgi:hypothetical protein
MAYAFDRVMSAVQKKDENNNIFDPQAAQRGATPKAPGSPVQRSSTAAELPASGGGAAAGGGAVGNKNSLPFTGGTKKSAFAKNYGKASAPVDVKALGQDISKAGEGLKGEEQAYLNNAGNSYQFGDDDKAYIDWMTDPTRAGDRHKLTVPGLGNEGLPPPPDGSPESEFSAPVVKPDFGGSPEDAAYWASVLNGTVGDVRDIDTNTNTTFGNADLLSTDAGVKELFRRGGGAEYNAGDAAFDTALLRGDKNFQTEREGLGRSYEGLKKQERDIMTGSRDKAREAAGGSLRGFQDQVREYFGGRQKGLESNVRGKEGAFDSGIRDAEKNSAQEARARAQIERRSLERDEDNARLKEYIDDGDPSAYYNQKLTADDTDWHDFVDDKDAYAFNNIATALGLKDQFSKGDRAGQDRDSGRSQAYDFDKEGYRGAVLGKAGHKAHQKHVSHTNHVAKVEAEAAAEAARQAAANQPGAPKDVTVDREHIGNPWLDKKAGDIVDKYTKPTETQNPFTPIIQGKPPSEEDAEAIGGPTGTFGPGGEVLNPVTPNPSNLDPRKRKWL